MSESKEIAERRWRIVGGAGRDASYLNGLRIVYTNGFYYLMTPPPNSTIIKRGEGDPPSFVNFNMNGSPWGWSLFMNSLTPTPHGTYGNSDSTPRPDQEIGSWSSEAVP